MCCLERREILVVREKDDATIVSGRLHLLTKPFEYSPWKPAGRTDSGNAANEGNVFEDRKTKRIVPCVESDDPPELVLQTEKARLLAVTAAFFGAGDSQSGQKEIEVCISIGIHLVVAIHCKAAHRAVPPTNAFDWFIVLGLPHALLGHLSPLTDVI